MMSVCAQLGGVKGARAGLLLFLAIVLASCEGTCGSREAQPEWPILIGDLASGKASCEDLDRALGSIDEYDERLLTLAYAPAEHSKAAPGAEPVGVRVGGQWLAVPDRNYDVVRAEHGLARLSRYGVSFEVRQISEFMRDQKSVQRQLFGPKVRSSEILEKSLAISLADVECEPGRAREAAQAFYLLTMKLWLLQPALDYTWTLHRSEGGGPVVVAQVDSRVRVFRYVADAEGRYWIVDLSAYAKEAQQEAIAVSLTGDGASSDGASSAVPDPEYLSLAAGVAANDPCAAWSLLERFKEKVVSDLRPKLHAVAKNCPRYRDTADSANSTLTTGKADAGVIRIGEEPLGELVWKTGPQRYTVRRGFLRKLVAREAGVFGIPFVAAGSSAPSGLTIARKDNRGREILHALGLEGGDKILAVNGIPWDQYDELMNLTATARSLQVTLRRDERVFEVNYEVQDE
jgi:hypothetical protein